MSDATFGSLKKMAANVLYNFPKQRSPLPPEFEAIYLGHYQNSREGKTKTLSIVRSVESWMHKRVAEDLAPGHRRSTLEIGAGTLNHLQYEGYSGSYDIVEPFRELYESSPNLKAVRNVYRDVSEVPSTARYERIISIATFEHICNLPEVVATSGLHLADDGQLRVAIPSEGTILWRLGWTFVTGVAFRLRYNLDYGVLMRHEHVNTAREIAEVLSYFYADVRSSAFGPAKSLSFYQFYACLKPRLSVCANYLASINSASNVSH
jgi:hypothetical protein